MAQTEIERKYFELISECDLFIKSGKVNQAIQILSTLVISQVPRSARRDLAKCCRRVGLISTGLRLLHPLIRGEHVLQDPPHPLEICEYSALLSRNGSTHEALELLGKVDGTMYPEALLYQGQCHIMNWDYAEAVIYFERFLLSSADDYTKLIARVNLISGYIVLFQFEEAQKTLDEAMSLAREQKALRLLANCFELESQVHFWKNDFMAARDRLKKASDVFDQVQSFDQLLILKTQALMQAFDEKSLEPLEHFRSLALQRRNWESVREADLFKLKIVFDQNGLNHLVFGTSRPAYRRRIEALVGKKSQDVFIFGVSEGPQINLQTAEVKTTDGTHVLPIGKKVHQLLSILTRDFYSPVNLGTLFYELYSNEYFNINSSPFRIRQAVLRARQWLKTHKIPAQIVHEHGAYRLKITGPCGFSLVRESQTVSPTQIRWEQLKKLPKTERLFTADEICHDLNWSRTTFRRVMDWALENQFIKKYGVGKATKYQLAIKTDKLVSKKMAA